MGPDIKKKKFLVPGTMIMGEFKYIIHKHIAESKEEGVASDQTIYLFVKGASPQTSKTLADVYEQYKSRDGFLYMLYSAENTLGSSLKGELHDGLLCQLHIQ